MSGPKVDDISIEQRRAMELEAERNRNAAMLHSYINKARSTISSLKTQCLNLKDHQSDFLTELDRLESSAISSITAAATYGYPAEITAARAFNDRAERELSLFLESLDTQVQPIQERVGQTISSQRELQQLEAFAESLSGIPGGEYGYFSTEFVEALLKREREQSSERATFIENSYVHTLDEAKACLEDVQLLIVSNSTDITRKESLTNLARQIQMALLDYQIDRSNIGALEGAISTARPILSEMKIHRDIMEELYYDCVVEARRLEEVSGWEATLPGLWEFREESELEEKLANLKQEYRHAAENAYIAYALDSVMKKHGYNVSRSVCLAHGEPSSHLMFMPDGSDVGIHALISPNGMIVMETASIDDSIRESEDGVRVERESASSSYDRLRLLEQQKSFCELHPELLADLAAFGVESCAKSDKPPSEENSVVFRAVGTTSADNVVLQESTQRTSRQGESLAERELR